MEAGVPTDPMELAQKAYAGEVWDDLGWEDIPTIYELETQLRKTKARKATGLDQIPGEIFKFAPADSAYHLYPLLQKMAAWSAEPVQYKGGRLAIAHKKGCPREVDHYRALLISSALGKSLHNVWRQRSLPLMRQAADPLQISAQPGALVAQAAHLVRLHLGAAKTRGISCYILFLDIRSAYYKLVRQFAFDLDNSDLGVLTLLHRLGVEHHIDDVATALQEQSTLRQLQCPEPLHRMVTTFHEQTWFQIHNDNVVIETQRGTRPGDGYADLVWNLVYSKFIHRLSARLQATGAYEPYTWNSKVGLEAAEGDQEEYGLTTTWADDTAVMGWHTDATSIVPMLRATTEIVYEELLRLGMQPNTKPGKTEALVDIRGAHSLTCRQHLHGPCKSAIALDVDDTEMNSLRVVPNYVHLGGMLVQQNKHLAEIKRRIALTHKSIAAHRSKVYGNHSNRSGTQSGLIQSFSIFDPDLQRWYLEQAKWCWEQGLEDRGDEYLPQATVQTHAASSTTSTYRPTTTGDDQFATSGDAATCWTTTSLWTLPTSTSPAFLDIGRGRKRMGTVDASELWLALPADRWPYLYAFTKGWFGCLEWPYPDAASPMERPTEEGTGTWAGSACTGGSGWPIPPWPSDYIGNLWTSRTPTYTHRTTNLQPSVYYVQQRFHNLSRLGRYMPSTPTNGLASIANWMMATFAKPVEKNFRATTGSSSTLRNQRAAVTRWQHKTYGLPHNLVWGARKWRPDVYRTLWFHGFRLRSRRSTRGMDGLWLFINGISWSGLQDMIGRILRVSQMMTCTPFYRADRYTSQKSGRSWMHIAREQGAPAKDPPNSHTPPYKHTQKHTHTQHTSNTHKQYSQAST